MSNILDRKYRPSIFGEVLGQDPVIDVLKAIVCKKLYRSAYMFEGPSGTGKTSSGRIFSKAILCESPINSDPCNKCDSCVLFDKEQHFGYRELDAATVGGKDDMVRLRDEAYSIPVSGKRIILIDEAQDISSQGQDALYKQLEECPDHLIYIFCTTEPEKIKKPLRDRCVEFSFSKVSTSSIFNQIKLICDKENISYEESALQHIAENAGGHVRSAIKNLEKVSCLGAITENIVRSMYKNYDEEIFEMLKFLGKDLKKVMEMYKKVSNHLSSNEIYNRILALVNDGANFLYGHGDFSSKRREMASHLRDIHGFGLLEFLKYLIEHDRFMNIESDLLVLHYKFGAQNFVPKTIPIKDNSNNNQVDINNNNNLQQNTTVPILSYSELSKKSIKERCEILRKQRMTQKSEQAQETENVPEQWPLPKEERFGEDSLDDEILSPQDFTRDLVGGRGGDF